MNASQNKRNDFFAICFTAKIGVSLFDHNTIITVDFDLFKLSFACSFDISINTFEPVALQARYVILSL